MDRHTPYTNEEDKAMSHESEINEEDKAIYHGSEINAEVLISGFM